MWLYKNSERNRNFLNFHWDYSHYLIKNISKIEKSNEKLNEVLGYTAKTYVTFQHYRIREFWKMLFANKDNIGKLDSIAIICKMFNDTDTEVPTIRPMKKNKSFKLWLIDNGYIPKQGEYGIAHYKKLCKKINKTSKVKTSHTKKSQKNLKKIQEMELQQKDENFRDDLYFSMMFQ